MEGGWWGGKEGGLEVQREKKMEKEHEEMRRGLNVVSVIGENTEWVWGPHNEK